MVSICFEIFSSTFISFLKGMNRDFTLVCSTGMYIFSIFIDVLYYFLICLLDCLFVYWRIPLDDGVINDLRENPAHRYSFVCNAILNICNTQDTDRYTTLNSKVLKICIDFRLIVYQMNSCCYSVIFFILQW